jgi:hypothetical protein
MRDKAPVAVGRGATVDAADGEAPPDDDAVPVD